MTSPPRDDAVLTTVRGACPSVHQPFAEPDGNLARVRLPAGVLSVQGARALAAAVDTVGGTVIELTNRANLQVRGVPAGSAKRMRDLLVEAQLAHPAADVDERRNVLASPTSGIDPSELVDARPHVAVALRRLTAPTAPSLSPKFGVLIDGGGSVHVRDRSHDLALGAVSDSAGHVVFEVRLAGALAERTSDRPHGSCWVVEPERVPALVDAVAAMTGEHGRVAALIDQIGARAVYQELARRIDGMSQWATDDFACVAGESESPVGVRPQREAARMSVGAIVPLGRLDPPTLHAVADLAGAARATELRISPRRELLVIGVSATDAPAVARRLDTLGLPIDPTHPAGAVVACAGERGCASAHADTLADAEALIEQLADVPVGARPRSVHVSGCEKGCAYPNRAEVSLVGSAGGVYAVHRAEVAQPDLSQVERRFGPCVHTPMPPEAARNAAVEIGRALESLPTGEGIGA